MPEAARLTDDTLCAYTESYCPHPEYDDEGDYIGKEHPGGSTPGNINSGSPNVFTNGLPAARITDTSGEWTVPDCTTGTGVIISGSGNVFINGLKAARKGDTVDPHTDVNGVITTGSPNVFIGG